MVVMTKSRSAFSKRIPEQLRFNLDEFPSRTQQSFKKQCDVNQIIARFQKTGELNHVRDGASVYMECTQIDFQDCMDRIVRAEEHFMSLPSKVRERFGNSVSNLLDFMSDEKNFEEAKALGLIVVPEEKKEVQVEPKSTPEGAS